VPTFPVVFTALQRGFDLRLLLLCSTRRHQQGKRRSSQPTGRRPSIPLSCGGFARWSGRDAMSVVTKSRHEPRGRQPPLTSHPSISARVWRKSPTGVADAWCPRWPIAIGRHETLAEGGTIDVKSARAREDDDRK